jgi:hypothetical protein
MSVIPFRAGLPPPLLTAIVLGTDTELGSFVVRELVRSPIVGLVHCLSEQPVPLAADFRMTPEEREKLRPCVIKFETLEVAINVIAASRPPRVVGFCCLGITHSAADAAGEFYVMNVEYPRAFFAALLHTDLLRVSILSAAKAGDFGHHRSKVSRAKGGMEWEVIEEAREGSDWGIFAMRTHEQPGIAFFRPSMMLSEGVRRRGKYHHYSHDGSAKVSRKELAKQRIVQRFALNYNFGIPVRDVAKAMSVDMHMYVELLSDPSPESRIGVMSLRCRGIEPEEIEILANEGFMDENEVTREERLQRRLEVRGLNDHGAAANFERDMMMEEDMLDPDDGGWLRGGGGPGMVRARGLMGPEVPAYGNPTAFSSLGAGPYYPQPLNAGRMYQVPQQPHMDLAEQGYRQPNMFDGRPEFSEPRGIGPWGRRQYADGMDPYAEQFAMGNPMAHDGGSARTVFAAQDSLQGEGPYERSVDRTLQPYPHAPVQAAPMSPPVPPPSRERRQRLRRPMTSGEQLEEEVARDQAREKQRGAVVNDMRGGAVRQRMRRRRTAAGDPRQRASIAEHNARIARAASMHSPVPSDDEDPYLEREPGAGADVGFVEEEGGFNRRLPPRDRGMMGGGHGGPDGYGAVRDDGGSPHLRGHGRERRDMGGRRLPRRWREDEDVEQAPFRRSLANAHGTGVSAADAVRGRLRDLATKVLGEPPQPRGMVRDPLVEI